MKDQNFSIGALSIAYLLVYTSFALKIGVQSSLLKQISAKLDLGPDQSGKFIYVLIRIKLAENFVWIEARKGSHFSKQSFISHVRSLGQEILQASLFCSLSISLSGEHATEQTGASKAAWAFLTS